MFVTFQHITRFSSHKIQFPLNQTQYSEPYQTSKIERFARIVNG